MPLTLLDLQPESGKLYSMYYPEKGLLTEYYLDEAVRNVVDSEKTGQWYWNVGHPIGVLTKLFVATGSEEISESG